MLKPLVVIIQDFPIFNSWFFSMKMFAIKCKTKSKQILNFHTQTLKLFAIKNKILDSMAYINQIALPDEIKFAIKSKASTFMSVLGKFSNQLAIKVNSIAKIKQKATGKIETGKFKAYLNKNGYIIGVPATLGYWDNYGDKDLDGMDVLTMSDLAVLKIN